MLMSPIPSIGLYSQRMLTVWWINKEMTDRIWIQSSQNWVLCSLSWLPTDGTALNSTMGERKKSSDYYCQKSRSPDTNTVDRELPERRALQGGNNTALPFTGTNSSPGIDREQVWSPLRRPFTDIPLMFRGALENFFPSRMSELIGILENILSTAFSSSDLWGKQGPERLGWHLASVTQSGESSGFQKSNAALCKDVMASLCTAYFPHPNLRGIAVLGRYPLQLTDLTLLRLCNDDLPRLDGSRGTSSLLALLLSLDLDSSGLLSQREVVLDGLRRSHRLAHLLLWGGRRLR